MGTLEARRLLYSPWRFRTEHKNLGYSSDSHMVLCTWCSKESTIEGLGATCGTNWLHWQPDDGTEHISSSDHDAIRAGIGQSRQGGQKRWCEDVAAPSKNDDMGLKLRPFKALR